MNKKILKIVILILIIMIEVLSVPKVDYGAGTNLKIGDVNGDGIIDSRDTLKILEHIAASNIPKIKQKHSDWILKNDKLKIADINEDEIVDSRDTVKELEYIAATTIPKIGQKHSNWKKYIENKWKIEATGISLNNTNITIEKEKIIQLKATVVPENASNKVVTWNPLDTKVATVDGIGNVTGKSEGIAVITARTSNGLTRTCQVKVIEPTPAETSTKATKIIASAPMSRQIEKGKNVQLTAKVSPDNATYKTITWSSSNTKVATVDNNGKIHVVGNGTAKITATQKENKITATYTIVGYTLPKSISFAKESTTIAKGGKEKLTVTFTPTDVSSKELTWTSSDTKVLKVKDGIINAIKPGTAVVTAKTTNGLTAKIKVTVKEIYDIILFTGQSNMVGKAMETIETRYNHNIYNYSGAKSVEQYSKMTGIDKNILSNNGKTLDFVSIKQTKNTVYEYMYLTNSFNEIDSTKKVEYGENLVYNNGKLIDYSKSSKEYYSLVKSKGTNMIPQFCKTYYNLTGHKVIAVFAAQGGVPIQTMLPHEDSRNNSRKNNSYMYEAIKTKYKAAEKLAKEKGLKIGNKLYIYAQGETNTELDTTTKQYKEIYMTIHKKLKTELGIEKGAIIETSYTTGYKTMKQVNKVHQAQEEIIKENSDIILGSSYLYDRFVPMESDYKNCNTKVTIGDNGNKLSYKEALIRSRYSRDPTIIDKATGKTNYIHFTSAALSQVGMEVAHSVSKIIK